LFDLSERLLGTGGERDGLGGAGDFHGHDERDDLAGAQL